MWETCVYWRPEKHRQAKIVCLVLFSGQNDTGNRPVLGGSGLYGVQFMPVSLIRSLQICFVACLCLWSPHTSAADKPVIVLVHGAWGGGWAFKGAEELLEDKGYRVYRPTLTGQGERHHLRTKDTDLNTHIQDVVSVLEFEELNDIVLLGHSYGGIVISGVAERVPGRIRKLIYLDALLLEDGESWKSVSVAEGKWLTDMQQGDGFVPPWVKAGDKPPKDVPHPVKTFTDSLSLTNTEAANIPGVYILTVEPGKIAKDDEFYRFSQRAEIRGWEIFILPADHNPQWSALQPLVDLIAQSAASDLQ
jgi:pimeloyl-ACP methyl ester carboxylesterase